MIVERPLSARHARRWSRHALMIGSSRVGQTRDCMRKKRRSGPLGSQVIHPWINEPNGVVDFEHGFSKRQITLRSKSICGPVGRRRIPRLLAHTQQFQSFHPSCAMDVPGPSGNGRQASGPDHCIRWTSATPSFGPSATVPGWAERMEIRRTADHRLMLKAPALHCVAASGKI